MLRTATVLFVLTALGGLLMAGIRFRSKENPPAWLAMLHGLLAASGLTLLAYAVLTGPAPPMATLALVLFVIAAAGGAVMSLAYKWQRRLIPAWLVSVHALLAILGFVLLVLAAYGDQAM